jgi:hypothetical protein
MSYDTGKARAASGGMAPRDFIDTWLFSCQPYAFSLYSDDYGMFRRELSEKLRVHPSDITLVGSARLGFSMNPSKLLAPFNEASDLDVVVVSSLIFDEAWCNLLALETSAKSGDAEEKRLFRKTRESFFDGYLRPDRVPVASWLSKEWFPKLAGPYKSQTAKRHATSAWLFKSWWHAEQFYANNIATIQRDIKKLLANEESK